MSILCLIFSAAMLPFGIRQSQLKEYSLLGNVKIEEFLSTYPKKKDTYYVLKISKKEKEIIFNDFQEEKATEIHTPMCCIIEIIKKYGFSKIEKSYYFYREDAKSGKWIFPEGDDEFRNAYIVMNSVLYENDVIVIHYH